MDQMTEIMHFSVSILSWVWKTASKRSGTTDIAEYPHLSYRVEHIFLTNIPNYQKTHRGFLGISSNCFVQIALSEMPVSETPTFELDLKKFAKFLRAGDGTVLEVRSLSRCTTRVSTIGSQSLRGECLATSVRLNIATTNKRAITFPLPLAFCHADGQFRINEFGHIDLNRQFGMAKLEWRSWAIVLEQLFGDLNSSAISPTKPFVNRSAICRHLFAIWPATPFTI
jgi:hypothetical protein